MVLDAVLKNLLYDDILRIKLKEGVTTVAFVDEFAIIAKANNVAKLNFNVNESLDRIVSRM